MGALGVFLNVDGLGESFSEPRNFTEFGSNLGEQNIVEVVRPWVGVNPQELAPEAIALGSLKNRTYVPAQVLEEKVVALQPVEEPKEVERPQEIYYPFELTGKSVPVENSAEGWVGPLPQELAPRAIPLGSLANRRKVSRISSPKQKPAQSEAVRLAEEPSRPSAPSEPASEPPLNMSIFASTRGYYSHNVLRLNGEDDGAGVWENMAGASLSTRPFSLGSYVTMVPSLDMLMQVAAYEDKEVDGANLAQILGYRFGMVKTGLSFSFPRDYTLSLGYEYTMLNSLDTGDKMSDGFAPSLRLGKMFGLSETALLMLDGSARYSMSERVLPYPIPGQFADDGDNYQLGISVSLIKLWGANGQFMLMPSLSVTRSEYVRNTNEDRVDWTTTLGLNGSWQVTEWLSLDLGATWTVMQMNDLGEDLQGQAAKYQALDIGGSLTASHSF